MGDVYLAGPITGLSYYGATAWRRQASEHLGMLGITTYDPTALPEAIEALGECDEYPALCEIDPRLAGRIIASNALALRRARAVIVGPMSDQSPGTMREIEQAMRWETPTVGVGECDAPVDIACDTVEAACEVAGGLCQEDGRPFTTDDSLSVLFEAIADAVAYGIPTPAAKFGLLSLLRHAVERLEGEGDV